MDDRATCRLCLNWVNGQYVFIDSDMIEKLQALCLDVKTILLEDSIICPSCLNLLQKFDYLRNEYKKTKEICKVCGVNVVYKHHVTSCDTLQMCDDLGFSVPKDSKVCDECMKTLCELHTFKVTLNNTQNGSIVHYDESSIKDEVELGPIELLQFHSNLLDELNACLGINTTRTEIGNSFEENDCNKNDELLESSEHQVLESSSNSIFEDDIKHFKEHNAELKRKIKLTENSEDPLEDPNELKTLGRQKSVFHYCDQCSFKSTSKGAVKTHSLVHKRPGEVPMFECHICKYETKLKGNLKKHLLIHKKQEDFETFECHIWKYKAIQKCDLRTHLLIHQEPEDVKIFECHICKYKAKQKGTLKTHLLIHKKSEDIEMFECHLCKYKARQKGTLKTHLLIHKKPEDVEMFKCHICKYKARQKGTLMTHHLIHKKPEDVEMFKCHICKYKARQKGTLKTHHLIHKKPEDVEMFECHICKYKTKQKGNLKSHLLIHKKLEDVETFKCYICEYKAKRMRSLKTHLLSHKKAEDVEIFECHI